jgi:hypothetical protein
MVVVPTSLAVVLARVLDVSLGTLGTIFIVQGRRFMAADLAPVQEPAREEEVRGAPGPR